jgi:crotonobetainyl-CoA:carnitine CoA-transferase CaiB-like acyl-CoA transferase
MDEDLERPDTPIAHPGVDAPFGIYPTEGGWVTIAMSPFRKLVEVLNAPELLQYEQQGRLYSERDEVWRGIAALTRKWKKADLLRAMLAADIWCGEVKTHREAVADPQVRHRGVIQSYEHPSAGTVKVVGPVV